MTITKKRKKIAVQQKRLTYQDWQKKEWSKTMKLPPAQIVMMMAWKVYKLENPSKN